MNVISILSFVILSIFIHSAFAVNAGELEMPHATRGLRGEQHGTGRNLEVRKSTDNKEHNNKDNGGKGGLLSVPPTNALGMVTWTITEPPNTITTSAPLSPPSIVNNSSTSSRVDTGLCDGGSIYWDPVAYPLWAGAVKCTNSTFCQETQLFSGCCQIGFCFCTNPSYGSKDECVSY